MPLASRTKVYKQLPPDLADSVFQAGRNIKTKGKIQEKCQCHDEQRKESLKKKHEPSSDICSSSEEPSTTKRLRTPQSDATGSSVPNTPMSLGSEDGEILELEGNVHPLSFPMRIRPPSAMETDSRNSSPPSPSLRPKLQRQDSRTTTSLDNVEMWESDSELETGDSNSSTFDRINGVLINPGKTYDLSELRKMRCSNSLLHLSAALAQTIPPSRSPNSTPSPRGQNTPRQISQKKGQPPKLSLPKTAIVDFTSFVSTERYLATDRNSAKEKNVTNTNLSSKNQCKSDKTIQSQKSSKCTFDTSTKDSLPGLRLASSSSYLQKAAGESRSLATSQRRESNQHRADQSATCCETIRSKLLNDKMPIAVEQRRVKFNSLVTVTDGDSKSTDILRRSSSSTGQLKQRLLKSNFLRPQSPISMDDCQKEYWEMIC